MTAAQGGLSGSNHLLRGVRSVAAIDPSILSLVKLGQGDVLFEKGEELDRVYFPHTLVASMLVVAGNGELGRCRHRRL